MLGDWDATSRNDLSYDAYDFCKSEIDGTRVVEGVDAGGDVIDLSSFGFDYLFFQRPYDQKLPRAFRSYEVVKHSKVCYMPYGMTLAPVFEQMHVNNATFMRNASFVFLSSKKLEPVFQRGWSHRIGATYRHFEALGYPSLKPYISTYVPPERIVKVLWTPRWSTDASAGGSHFFDYMNDVVSLAEDGFEVLMRPHQLMWPNLLSEGLMTQEDVDAYKTRALQAGCRFSEGRTCLEDFEWSDVIIADYSSIVPEYFVSGKPMIFCPPPFEVNELMKELMRGMYVANNWSEISGYLKMLASGNDPKRAERIEIAHAEFGDANDAAERIAERLWEYARA